MHVPTLVRLGLTASLLALASCTSAPATSRRFAAPGAALSGSAPRVLSVSTTPRTAAASPLRSVVRVEVPELITADFERFRSGTGVYLGHGRIITAHHVIAEGPAAPTTPTDIDELRILPWDVERTERHNLTELGGRVDGSPFLDLAVINANKSPLSVEPARVAERRPAVGEQVVAYGLGGGAMNQVREMKGRVVGRSLSGSFIAIDAPSIKGDSGGPVFNDQGELVGIILGGGPDYAPWRVEVFPERALPFHFTYPDFERARPIDGATLVLDLTAALPRNLGGDRRLTDATGAHPASPSRRDVRAETVSLGG